MPDTPPIDPLNNQPPSLSPFELAIDQRIKALETNNPNQNSAILTGIRPGERWLIGINGALLFATVVIALIYKCQLTQMIKATTATQQAAYDSCLTAKIANATLIEIKAGGVDSHNLAAGSVIQASTAARAEAARLSFNRAQEKINFATGSPLVTPVVIDNVGQSDAFHISFKAEVKIVPAGTEPSFTYGSPPMNFDNTGILFKGEPHTFPIAARDKGKDILLNASDINKIRDLSEYVIAYGIVTYRDIFGVHHWTNFCLFFEGPRSGTAANLHEKCASYNNSDTNLILPRQTIKDESVNDKNPIIICKEP